jgi:hypothetical protein
MKRHKWVLVSLAVLFSLFMTASCGSLDGGTVIITNNTNKEYAGRVWTDSEELYNGRIRAWNAKTFLVSKDDSVYTDFESNDGDKSSPSGYVSRGRTLIIEL